MEWTERGSLKPSSNLPMARNPPNGKNGGRLLRDPCHRVTMKEMNLGAQSGSAKEASEAVEAKLSPALHPESRVILGANAPATSQDINTHLRSLGAPGIRKSVLSPRISVLQDPGEPCLQRKVFSEYQPNMRLESENQPQDCATYKPVTPSNLASQVPHCHPQSAHCRQGSFPGAMWPRGSSKGQPRVAGGQDLKKTTRALEILEQDAFPYL